jgi:hypothetical protein
VIVLASLTASAQVSRAPVDEDDLPVGSELPRVVPIAVADSYYAFHDPRPATRSATLMSTADRHNEFAVNLLAIGARLEHAKLTGTVVLHAGTSVDALYASTPSSIRSSQEVWKHIQLANVGWRTGDFHLQAGVMPSLHERESFVSTDNWNYTRAMIADSTPYYVLGARVTWRLTPTFAATATAFNGYDTFGDRNRGKTGQLRFIWQPTDNLTIANSTLGGPEQEPIEGKRAPIRFIDDLLIEYKLHARVHLALEGWLGTERNANVEDPRKGTVTEAYVMKHPTFYGATAWAKWQFAETTYLAVRGETAHDPAGVVIGRGARTGGEPIPGQRLYAGTFTFGWQPHPRMIARVEATHRASTERFFRGGDDTSYIITLPLGGDSTFSSDARKSSTTFVVSAAFAY